MTVTAAVTRESMGVTSENLYSMAEPLSPSLSLKCMLQARRLGGFGGFGRTARTQAKVRGAEADADLSPLVLKKK